MPNIVLTAGRAVRMGALAPHGCKAMAVLNGRPLIEWQLDVLGEASIVCRHEHADLLRPYGPLIFDESLRGPVGALKAALRQRVDDPVTVVYADSFFTSLPDRDEWCGTGRGEGGREWDVIASGTIEYRTVSPSQTAKVCVGLYRFADPWRLALRVAEVTASGRAVGMPSVLSSYSLPFVDIPSWRDYGSAEKLRAVA